MEETGERWTTVGVVLRVAPDLLMDFLDELERRPGMSVVFYKTSKHKLRLREEPY